MRDVTDVISHEVFERRSRSYGKTMWAVAECLASRERGGNAVIYCSSKERRKALLKQFPCLKRSWVICS